MGDATPIGDVAGAADVGRAAVARARELASAAASDVGGEELAGDAALVMSELVTNAILHGGGCTGVDVRRAEGGVRLEVRDRSRVPPLVGHASESSLTGRGVRLVATLASAWGVELEGDGKVVWAVVTGARQERLAELDASDILDQWDDWDDDPVGHERHRVELGDVPTDLLLAAKAHVENVVRELALAAAGADAGVTHAVPAPLVELTTVVLERFAEARLSIKRQALDAARRGDETTRLTLDLPASAADAALEYLAALDEVDAYSRASRMLTLETPPQHRVFRQWYIGELVAQLRAAAAGEAPPRPQPFQRRLLAELDRVAAAQRVSDRAVRLFSVAVALASAATPEAVAEAVLNEGVAALRASGGGLLLATDDDRLVLPGAVGYDEAVVARLRSEPRTAELPAAVALRTGEPIWLESRHDAERRFPDLIELEATTVSLCAVPVEVQGRRLGAMRFSFTEPRLFDEDERRFVVALAALTAQALERAQLQRARLDVSTRLQRSLLPPSLPDVPGIDAAAVYHPFGDGIEVGGDFYDLWAIDDGVWGVAIGDASGTGPEAAALTAMVRHTMRAVAEAASSPADVVSGINRAACRWAAGDDGEGFCTVVFGMLRSGPPFELQLAGGGHPPVTVRRADGRVEEIAVGGTVIGLFDDAEVGQVDVELRPGDTVVMLTDGILEARRDGTQFSNAGVERVVATETGSAAALAGALEHAVVEHSRGVITDDMAAVVLRVVGQSR